MRTFSTVVIGGGAAGIVAAISAGRSGSSVLICEKTPRIGRKILASGNGRCNLSNDDLGPSFYNPSSRHLVETVFANFGRKHINAFFTGLGLQLHSEEGRIFPATNQAASVLKVLEIELHRLAIPVECHFDVTSISRSKDGFLVTARSGAEVSARSVVVAGGGKSYPALGSDGSTYKLAERFGHSIVEPVPVAVPLNVKDPLCHALQGQKIPASVACAVNGISGKSVAGDILFTKYGLSGTAILDISADVSIALNRDRLRSVSLSIDMVPFMSIAELASELKKRADRDFAPVDMVAGILPNKFGPALSYIFKTQDAPTRAHALKNRIFTAQGTRGWNEAEFTSGGIDTREVEAATLESRFVKGLYLAGEVLDVDGKRGGYNLAWAWASGHAAGEAASHA